MLSSRRGAVKLFRLKVDEHHASGAKFAGPEPKDAYHGHCSMQEKMAFSQSD